MFDALLKANTPSLLERVVVGCVVPSFVVTALMHSGDTGRAAGPTIEWPSCGWGLVVGPVAPRPFYLPAASFRARISIGAATVRTVDVFDDDLRPIVPRTLPFASSGPVWYSNELLSSGAQGGVLMRALVDTTGSVRFASVLKSTHRSLEGCAQVFVRRARFQSARLRGSPRWAVAVVPVEFRIDR